MPPKNKANINKKEEILDEKKIEKNKTIKNKKVEESDKEDNSEDNLESENNSESESESESEEKEKKVKKVKESFEELTKKLEILQGNMKEIEKEIKDLQKQTEIKEKLRRDYERQVSSIGKILLKTHKDELTKAVKDSKSKRKGNINGGFNKETPVPTILCKFLNLPEETCMSRPKVFGALNNKLTNLGLRNGQNITIDKATAKALNLGEEYYNKQIKFTEVQSFLKSFYPEKEIKEIEA
jgi:hypothetical protein